MRIVDPQLVNELVAAYGSTIVGLLLGFALWTACLLTVRRLDRRAKDQTP